MFRGTRVPQKEKRVDSTRREIITRRVIDYLRSSQLCNNRLLAGIRLLTSCHARRELFAPKLQYSLSFKYI